MNETTRRLIFKTLSKHRDFESKAVSDLELIPTDDSSRVQLASINLESAFVESEQGCHCRDDLWKQPRLSPREDALINGFMASVDESVCSPIVPMEVAKDLYTIVETGRPLHFLLEEEHFWMDQRARLGPAAV